MNTSARYKYLFDKYYLKVFEDRVQEIVDIFIVFLRDVVEKDFVLGPESYGVTIDELRLSHLVKSYFYDVIRYKEFHFSSPSGVIDETIHLPKEEGGKYIDGPKQSAYMIKWLVKVKPISIDRLGSSTESQKQETVRITVNEVFAYVYANAVLDLAFNDDRAEHMIYQLHYRPYEEGAFERLFSAWLGKA